MKKIFLHLFVILAALLAADSASAASRFNAFEEREGLERSVAAEADVEVSVCLQSGNIVVSGWDKREVRARATDARRLDLRRAGAANGTNPAKRVEVSLRESGGCSGSGNLELDVPQGATVILKVMSGDVDVSNVAAARIDSGSGDVELRRIAKAIEISSLSGNIFIKESNGRVRLRAISGDVEAVDLRTKSEDGDQFIVNSTSGNIRLDRVESARIEASTMSGDVQFIGPLTRSGVYNLKTHSGDVMLELPANASFKIDAKVVTSGEIITDFPVKSAGNSSSPVKPPSSRLTGIVGNGEADVTLSSFSGSVQLRKKQ